MAHLIQLRNRIKAIETIKKITHAMRLISMSSHTRLRHKDEMLREYLKETRRLLSRISQALPEPTMSPFMHSSSDENQHNLIILIGSQRGLCGNFNTVLFHFFNQTVDPHRSIFITIGKKATHYLIAKNYRVEMEYPQLSLATMDAIAESLTKYFLQTNHRFTQVQIISNKLKTFFIQKPHLTTILPFNHSGQHDIAEPLEEEYLWEQDPSELLNYLIMQSIQAQIHYLLFQSLISEQAARFISMDNATRNAQRLLETTKLSYNKLRQAKITKELTELTSSF